MATRGTATGGRRAGRGDACAGPAVSAPGGPARAGLVHVCLSTERPLGHEQHRVPHVGGQSV
jgi:hypothetical protein